MALAILRNEQDSLPVGDLYVQAGSGFAAMNKLNTINKARPWFKRCR